ncbi:threonylcarbamoyl-AMP synthase [archaeon]|nr:threonylcarbamoyl-AMP synthase [archaeon]
MPEIIDFKDIDAKEIVKRMKAGEIFIYPTDTVYGIGCNAMKSGSVAEIRKIKRRNDDKPMSVIAPSKKWIYDNFEVNKKGYIQTLPGPFTFILNIKNRCVARNVNPKGGSLGVRIPYHAFTRLVKRANIPFITTSVNFSGRKPIREIKDISRAILRNVDVVIDDGFLHNHPSTLIDLTEEMAKIVRR